MIINQNMRSFPKPSLVSAGVPPPIPAFPVFAPIALGHKKIFDAAFVRVNPQNSEFCFGYLFSWQRPLALEASLFGGHILIRGNLAGADFIFPPIPSGESTSSAGPEAAARAAVEALVSSKEKKLSAAPRIICAPEKLAETARAIFGDIVDTCLEREYFDYVYRAGDLTELAGDKYQSKRNFVNRFKKNHNFEYKILDADTAALCLGFQKKWREMKLYSAPESSTHMQGLDEDTAARELLENFDALDLRGCAIFVGSDIIAFSVGECLNGDTLVMHLEKADTSYAGSYQTMSRLAAKTAVSMGYAYINKEEDLGLPNLRKAKMSYHPANFVSKYEIRLKEEVRNKKQGVR